MTTAACPHCRSITDGSGRFCTQCGQTLLMPGPPGTTIVMQQQQGTGQGDGLSLAAMIVGLVSFVVGAPISSIVAIVMGMTALNRGVSGTDRTYALVGIWTGVASAVLTVFMLLFMFSIMGAPFMGPRF